MKYVAIVLVCLIAFTQASIPSRRGLRLGETTQHLNYKEVTAPHLAANSVEREDIQDFSVDTQSLLNRMVTNSKMAPLAVNSGQVAPGAVTSMGAAIDLVELFIRNDDTIPAASQNAAVVMPENQEAVQPWEAIRDSGTVRVDDPSPATSYRVEGKARGPGVILGWYPSQNGHLLRYQSSRALRGIVCAAIDVQDINRRDECTCSVLVFDDDGFGFFDDDTLAAFCSCDIDITFIDVNWRSTIADCGGCTVLDCGSDNADDNDPMCNNQSEDQRMNPFDDDDAVPGVGDHLPDRCNPYTSVEDVNNPQEGVPVYSPTVERITIDDTGRVEMRFFGRGTVDGPHDPIRVTVVVLLDDQYGA